MLNLKASSYGWAVSNLVAESDTDLFPKPFEFDVLESFSEDIIKALQSTDIETYSWSPGRRVVVPKGELSFRAAIQLDPWDSLILTALIKEFGELIERKRLSYREKIAFSYRFEPMQNGEMYQRDVDWPSFWEESLKKARSIGGFVAITDISNCYQQISHPVLEDQLLQARIPEKAVISLMQLCSALTAGVPRGIPIGPYAFHLLAECVFDIIDRNLLAKKYTFCRFVDDFHIFCKTKEEARIAIYDLTNILDKGLQLSLQGHKSKILDSDEFIELAQHVLIDAPPPIMDLEKAMIDIIDRYSNGDRYRNINTACLTEEDLAILSQPNLETVLNSYLAPTLPSEPNFTRIRWFFRRLKQVGVPGAIPIAIEKLEQFSPAVADLAGYLLSARMNYSLLEWRQVGNEILHSLDLPIIQRSEYLTVILLDLFARLPVLNHLDSILQRYETRSSPMEKRKIVRIATVHRAAYWLPQIIEQSFLGDPWLRRSLIAGASAFLGKAERNNWLNRFNIRENKLDTLIAQWALSVTLND